MRMNRPFDVLVVGEINPDLILSGDVEPVFGQVEKLVEHASLTIGSSSAIFACGAARLGLKVAFIGKVGRDQFGQYMRSALAERGVDTSGVIIDPDESTGLSVILAKDGDRAILTYPGVIPTLRLEEMNLGLLSQTRHLHLGSYFIQDGLRPDVPRLFSLAHQQGVTVSLDTNYDPAEDWDNGLQEALAHTDIFLPNETECCKIAGLDDLQAAVDSLAERVGLVAVKCGARGAQLRAGSLQISAASIPVDVVDTVGAGDSFDAGFITGFLSGWDYGRSLRLAAVCGALSTRAAGGTPAQATMAEALTYL
jgi:sugar/nucleoside kinase (ribokinase family)